MSQTPIVFLSLLALLALQACTTPADRFIDAARQRRLTVSVLDASQPPLVVFMRSPPAASGSWHIYLDGDGTPLLSRHRVAKDPSSRSHLILDLMERDPDASLLLGRPCYYLEHNPCPSRLWTDARYSEAVVDAMVAAIRAKTAASPAADINLIGYSGGGALAMLIAPRLEHVRRVVTIAANLDTTAWASHHGYSPLQGSMNPADQPPLPAHIQQLHLFGGRDTNVPVDLMRAAAERSPASVVRVIEAFDHGCCWASRWPALLKQ